MSYKIIGVDEAGKGPVLGDFFIGFSQIELEDKNQMDDFNLKLKENGVCDSKKITQKNRVLVLEKISKLENIKVFFEKLTPLEIDENSKISKLNELEINKICTFLNEHKPDLIIIDSLLADTEKFKEIISNKLDFECEIISENKADVKFPIVGLASIVAKVNRELAMEKLREEIKIDFGSGYPNDPKTKEFLKDNWNKKEYRFLFRTSWETYKRFSRKTIFNF